MQVHVKSGYGHCNYCMVSVVGFHVCYITCRDVVLYVYIVKVFKGCVCN